MGKGQHTPYIIKQEKPCGMTPEGVFQGRHREAQGGEMSGAVVVKAVPVEPEDAGSDMLIARALPLRRSCGT